MARIGCGKSGGCRTCRTRKVKCDERRPACERCQRANRNCEGYVAENRFVDENSRTERHAKRKSLPQAYQPKAPSGQNLVVSFISKSGPGLDLGLRAFEDNIYVSYMLSNLFLGIPITTPLWPHHPQAEDSASVSGTISLHALATMYFGRVHHQNFITVRGQALYGQALLSLNRDLQDTQGGLSLSVVISAMVLELYEFVAFNSVSGWLKHAGGVGRLIELRGPWRHQSPRGRAILEASRLVIILECLIKRKRCFLSSADWKTIPWALEPESKTSASHLHDILCDLPGLIEDIDNIQFFDTAATDLPDHHDLVVQELTSLWTTLYKWRASWQIQNPTTSWVIPSETDQSPFPMVLQFSSLIHAIEINLYNAILLLLFKIGFQIFGPSFKPLYFSLQIPTDIDYHPHIPPSATLNVQIVAIEICKSVEYYLHEDRRTGGALFLLFPLRLAWQTFEQSSAEATWIQGVMEMIADSTAIEISRGLTRELIIPSSA